ncbi:MAG TPA: phage holin family protein [Spirochaetota bacterium]|nr:phage holin family protein [Spirochaetota bacterium]
MAKKNKQKNNQSTKTTNSVAEQSDNVVDGVANIVSGVFAPIKMLVKIHLKLAAREIKRDGERFVTGILSIFIGIFLLLTFLAFLNILIIIALKDYIGLSFFYSVLIVAGANLLLAILLFIVGSMKLKASFMKETRKMIKETLEEIS